MCSSFLRNGVDPLEHQKQRQESAVVLGSHGLRLRDVALRANCVDLLRGVSPPGGPESVCRGCCPFPARRPHDGGIGGAAAYSTKLAFLAPGNPRLFPAPSLVSFP